MKEAVDRRVWSAGEKSGDSVLEGVQTHQATKMMMSAAGVSVAIDKKSLRSGLRHGRAQTSVGSDAW